MSDICPLFNNLDIVRDAKVCVRRLNVGGLAIQIQQLLSDLMDGSILIHEPGILNFLFEYPALPRPIPSRRLPPVSMGGSPDMLFMYKSREDEEVRVKDAAGTTALLLGGI